MADSILTTSSSSTTSLATTAVIPAPVPVTNSASATSESNSTTSSLASSPQVQSVWVVPTALSTESGSLSLPQPTPGAVSVTSGFNGYTTAVDVILYYNELSSSALTPAAACNNTVLSVEEANPDAVTNTQAGMTNFLYGGGCDGRQAGFVSSCLPNGALPLSDARVNVSPNVLVETHAVFSPAAGCPVGYSSACTLGGLQAGATKSGESAIACCPQGFRCGTSDGYCSKSLSSGHVVMATVCNAAAGADVTFITVSDNDQHVRAPPLYIVKAAALPAAPSSGSSQSISNTPALQAAIGVSVSLGVILLTLLGFLAWRYKRRRRLAKAAKAQEEEHGHGNEKGNSKTTTQDTLHEAHAESRRIEADAQDTERHVYELPGECLPELPEDAFQPMEVAGKEVEKKTTASTGQKRTTTIADLSNANINATQALLSPTHLPSPTISSFNNTPESTLDSTMVSSVSSAGRRFSF